MEKGLKNLAQACRSAQKKQGTYTDSHDDSGIGISDLEEESDDRHPELPDVQEAVFQYHGYPTAQPHPHPHQQQRVPSIQALLGQYPGPGAH